jgi:hypothetical protein
MITVSTIGHRDNIYCAACIGTCLRTGEASVFRLRSFFYSPDKPPPPNVLHYAGALSLGYSTALVVLISNIRVIKLISLILSFLQEKSTQFVAWFIPICT